MAAWLANNVGTIIICAILICLVAFIVIGIIRDKKKGKSPCCGNCAGCAMANACHGKQPQKKK